MRHTVPALALYLSLVIVHVTLAQDARVQFINAFRSPEATAVDVYVDGVRLVDDLGYRRATPFLELPTGTYLSIDITDGGAVDNKRPLHSSLWTLKPYRGIPSARSGKEFFGGQKFYPDERLQTSRVDVTIGERYVIIIAGDPMGPKNPSGIDLFGRSGAQPESQSPYDVDAIFFVGVPRAAGFEVHMRGVGGNETVIPSLGYGEFSSRLSVAPVEYDVEVISEEDSLIQWFVQDYRNMEDRLVVSVVSGPDPSDVFMVLSDGAVVPNRSNPALVQFINDSPLENASTVDIYVNDRLRADDLGYREATPFLKLPARLSESTAPVLKIDVTSGNDVDNRDPLYTVNTKFRSGQPYVSVVAGHLEGEATPSQVELFTYDQGRLEAAVEGYVDLLLFHGSFDTPPLDVAIEGDFGALLAGHLDFGSFASYRPVPPLDMTLIVTTAENHREVARIHAPLHSMGAKDSALVILTSGTVKSGVGGAHTQRDFGLVVAFPSGGKMISLEATIPVPWWQSVWFVALALLGLVAIVVGAAQIRIHRLRRRARDLSTLVAERTKELTAEKWKTELQANRLMELDRAKNRFFANISHEFRTPITLILGPLQDLLDGVHGKLSEQGLDQIRIMRRSAQGLLHLINQLLDLARLDADKLQVHVSRVDLVAHLRALVRSFVPAAERESIRLEFRSEIDELCFGSDPDMLTKVFSNLLSNAVKFTPAGGKVWVTVNVPIETDSTRVEVVVKDTGPGISKENLARIFDRFASFDPVTNHGESGGESEDGIGIGLSLAKELVEAHDGSIVVESELGFGSTFTVRLPRRPVPSDAGQVGIEDHADDDTTGDLTDADFTSDGATVGLSTREESKAKRPVILIVEDNSDVRGYLRMHLGAEFGVVEATNGREGLELAKKVVPDLVLADVRMPVMDGYTLCRKLKEDEKLHNVPVVMLTAKVGEADTIEGLRCGADDYIAKPFSMAEVKARIANLIASRQGMRAQYSREVLLQPAGIAVESDEEVFLTKVMDVIETNLGDNTFGVERLAEEVGISPRHLDRRLDDLTGETPSKLIQRLRLERASQLLRARAGTVSEVAYRVGFKSTSHFSAIFKERFGASPSEYCQPAP